MCLQQYILGSSCSSWYLIISCWEQHWHLPSHFPGENVRNLALWQLPQCGHSSDGDMLLHTRCASLPTGMKAERLWHPYLPLLNPCLHLYIINDQQSTVILEVAFWEGTYKRVRCWHESLETFCIAQAKLWGRLPWSGQHDFWALPCKAAVPAAIIVCAMTYH